jgi:hypothetical protein
MSDPVETRRCPWEIAGHAAFVLLLLGVAIRLLVEADPQRQNVYLKVFARAGEAFAAGQPLYELEHGFRYPPIAAALFAPFTWLGPRFGSIAWRLAGAALLWFGVQASLRRGLPRHYTRRERGLFWLLLVPALIGSVNNGQPNALVLGLLLWATAAAWRGQPQRSGLLVAATAALKVYPLAQGLLLGVLRPRLLIGLAVGSALAAALPFVLQDPDYVAGQYRALVDLLRVEDRSTDPANAYRDLRLLLLAAGWHLPTAWFLPLQALSGAALAGLCLWLQRRKVADDVIFSGAFALMVCWFMLFGPATERVTYCLLAPALIWPVLDRNRPRWRVWVVLNALYLLDHVLAPSRNFQAAHVWSRCPLPALALATASLWVVELVQAGRRSAARPNALG